MCFANVSIFAGSIQILMEIPNVWVQDGAPKIAKLPYKWFNYGLL